MAKRTRTQYKAIYSANTGGAAVFKDNTTGAIGADDMRNQNEDISDSVMFLSDFELDLHEIDVTTAVDFDFEEKYERLFYASDTIDGARTWSITTNGNARSIKAFTAQIDAGAPQTLPTDSKIVNTQAQAQFESGVWTPAYSGQYYITATKGANVWWFRIEGPISQ